MLFAFMVVALVHGVVGPNLLSVAVLKVIFPLSLVSCPILMDINAIAVSLVVKPFSLEDVAINVPELALAARLVEPPVAFVLGSVLPNLDSVAVLHVA